MFNFCQIYGFKNLLSDPTCRKNPENPACTDLIMKNKPSFFQNSFTTETELSDLYKMTTTILKTYFKK